MNQLNVVSSAASLDPALARLVDELTAKLQRREPIDLSAVLTEHPEYANDLRELLPALAALGDLSQSATTGQTFPIAGDGSTAGTLGDYRLIREVGRGGMGIVYEAEQISLDRRVALKVLPFAATMDPKQLQRFHNEAKAAASLHHEHIVPVYAVGSERGVHYYAMQFVNGHTLADLITARAGVAAPARGDVTCDFHPNGQALTPPVAALSTRPDMANGRAAFRQAAEWIADAADALEFAHSMGIVHRDVKPANLMVDAAGKIWVADFGLARVGPDAGLTMSGDLLGTLRYMAPEQALARHGLADHRVDVYGLGATLYELLSGKPAVGGTDKADVIRRIAFEEPIAPRKLDKHIPAELETIALKCLAKNPNERYATAGDLAADLRRFVEDKPIKAKPPGMRERTVRWLRRHRALTASAAVIAVAAIAMAAGSVGYVVRDRAARLTVTEQKANAALMTAREAIASNDFALANRKVSEAAGQLGADSDALPAVAADIDRVQADIHTRLDDTARFQRFLKLAEDAEDRLGFHSSFRGDQVAQEALAIYGVLENDDWIDRVRKSTLTEAQQRQVRDVAYFTVVTLAELGVRSGNERNKGSANHSLDLLKRAEAFHEPTRAFYFARAECYDAQGNKAGAEAEVKRYKAASAQTAWDHYLPGRTIQQLAYAGGVGSPRRRFSGQAAANVERAIRLYRAALALQPNHYNALFFLAQSLEWKESYAEAAGVYTACLAVAPVQGRADVYAHRSWCYRQTGQVEAADADFAAAMSVDTDSFMSQGFLAFALHEQGRADDAITVHRRMVNLTPKDVYVLERHATSLQKLGRDVEAEAAFRRAVEQCPEDTEGYWSYSLFLRGQGRFAEAESVCCRALERWPNDATFHEQMGCVLQKLSRHAEAEAAFRRAIALKPDFANAYCNLGMVLQMDGRFSEGLAACRKGAELGSQGPGWEYPRGQWIRYAERLAKMDQDGVLPGILQGDDLPADETDIRAVVAYWMYHGRSPSGCRTVAMARSCSKAFSAIPDLANDLDSQNRYSAVRAAALAAGGQGTDAAELEETERTDLRRLAFNWLASDFAAWSKRAETVADPPDRRSMMRRWQTDPDLASVRDAAALDKLPEAERVAWQKLWADVEALKKHCEEPPAPPTPPPKK